MIPKASVLLQKIEVNIILTSWKPSLIMPLATTGKFGSDGKTKAMSTHNNQRIVPHKMNS